MSFVYPIQKSLSDFIVEFEKLKAENEKLKEFIRELSKEHERQPELKFAKFFDLTFLYPGGFPGCVQYDFKDEYHQIIKKHISENKHKYNDGDIIFIGSTYETNQEYGFATIRGNRFITGKCPEFTPGVYYVDAIDEINKFWLEFEEEIYYTDDNIFDFKEQGVYEP